MKRSRFRLARGVALLLSLLAFCLGPSACGRGSTPERRVNVYIWTEYLPDDVVAEFERQSGIDVHVDLYDSNEALLAKLQSGVAGYDLVVPSDYMMKIMIPGGLLQPLDRARLRGVENLEPRLLDQSFDPGNRHSVPYLWGTTGLGYDRTRVAAPVDSWQAVFDPRHAGRILLLDDVREVFGIALRLQGRSVNERDPAALRRAAELLKRQKRLVRTYNSSDFANLLAAGDVDLAQGYNGEIAKVVAGAPDRFAYVVPREGGTLWIDSLAIPKDAPHPAEAHELISYLLEPEVAARIVNAVRYAGANRAARPHVDPAILADPAVYPPPEVLDRCELIEDLGEVTPLLDQLWTEVKAQ